MIWAKLRCPPKFFWASTAMVSSNVFFVFIYINLLWGFVNNGQPLHELHNNKSLRTPDIDDFPFWQDWLQLLMITDDLGDMNALD